MTSFLFVHKVHLCGLWLQALFLLGHGNRSYFYIIEMECNLFSTFETSLTVHFVDLGILEIKNLLRLYGFQSD